MKNIFRGAAALAVLIGFASTLVSCGSSSSPTSGSSGTPTPVPTATNTPLPTPPPYKTTVGSGYNPEGLSFSPSGNSSYVSYDNSAPGQVVFYNNWFANISITVYGATALSTNTKSTAVDPSSGNVYVMDETAQTIYEYTPTGSTAGSLTGYGTTAFGGSTALSDIAVEPNGNLYVADSTTGDIYEYNSAGTTLTSWNTGYTPIAIGISPVSPYNVYVGMNTNTNDVIEYSSSGTAAVTWGGTATTAGVGQGKFEEVERIGVGPNGNVYVSDGQNGGNQDNFVQEFSPSGAYYTQWGGTGTANGQFTVPMCIAFNAGDVYVIDNFNGRIQVFGP
jgi:hypothetical protein